MKTDRRNCYIHIPSSTRNNNGKQEPEIIVRIESAPRTYHAMKNAYVYKKRKF